MLCWAPLGVSTASAFRRFSGVSVNAFLDVLQKQKRGENITSFFQLEFRSPPPYNANGVSPGVCCGSFTEVQECLCCDAFRATCWCEHSRMLLGGEEGVFASRPASFGEMLFTRIGERTPLHR
eukprot:TRINITY_DN12821_c0_g1_i8.p2 TRINITY_DN12821_c0_g1~~TRINITY_DN12821_c0_g1_i8.p2  ORF type:complete len:123 (+),score=2.51 TRINITY_DN12821_c0_g1_i8:985-1353(+)